MININIMIAKNIENALGNSEKNWYDLATEMNYSERTINDTRSGVRIVNAIELKKIASFCNVFIEDLVMLPKNQEDIDIIQKYKNRVKTTEARQGIEYADKIIDMYLFHSRINKNASKMSEQSSL